MTAPTSTTRPATANYTTLRGATVAALSVPREEGLSDAHGTATETDTVDLTPPHRAAALAGERSLPEGRKKTVVYFATGTWCSDAYNLCD